MTDFTLADAIALAEFAHRNQKDKAGFPYIDHPKRVLAKVQEWGGTPTAQMAAVLHDVVEDTPFTPDMLTALGVPAEVVGVVNLLTKIPGEENEYYYFRIRNNSTAQLVKIADIEDNSQPWRKAYLDADVRERLTQKYKKAMDILVTGSFGV